MQANTFKTILFLVFVLLVFIVIQSRGERGIAPLEKGTVSFYQQNVEFKVEIAKTEKQRAYGLMYRPVMALNEGMLFIFDRQANQRVWMKNTLIALDVIFLSSQGKIVSILQSLKPCEQKQCKVYNSIEKAKYMLELNAGVVENSGLKLGQTFAFDSE